MLNMKKSVVFGVYDWLCLILGALNSHKYVMGGCLLRSRIFAQPLPNIVFSNLK